jgi:hemerythrin
MSYTYTTWTPDLATGSTDIDKQHKQLIAAVNSLFNAQRSGQGKHEVTRTLTFLLEYTNKHFADEEALQEKYKYPDRAAHMKIHNEFKAIAQELAQEYRSKPSEAHINHICSVIGRWVIHHIKGEDCKMAEHVLRRMNGEEDEPDVRPAPPRKKGLLRSLLGR